MRKIFFDSMGTAQPNKAHQVLANLEKKGIIKGIITQNIDGLHQSAGSKNVVEFHGTINTLACIDCNLRYKTSEIDISKDIPRCPSCNGILKPDFVFYGEGINKNNYDKATNLAIKSDLVIMVGTAGQVMPACYLPFTSQKYGAYPGQESPVRHRTPGCGPYPPLGRSLSRRESRRGYIWRRCPAGSPPPGP